MGKYAIIKKEFKFLETSYGFKIFMKQKSGAYYYIGWTNSDVDIIIFYDEQVNVQSENPVKICIFAVDMLGVEYSDEFSIKYASPKEKIHYAAEWLKSAIMNKNIKIV